MADDGEDTTLCEPLMVAEESPHYGELVDLAVDLSTKSAALSASLPTAMRSSLADAVRAMNCYYSNLIEGHDTHPISADRAVHGELSADPQERNLQLEAVAHINVQKWIDEGGLTTHATAPRSIREIHRRFCNDLPDELLITEDSDTGEKIDIIGGQYRDRFVRVGAHIPISPGAVPRFMDHIHKRYNVTGRVASILSAAYAHHRISWVHPFFDLNGRVVRMVSHAMLLNSVGSAGLWSVSRGLARRSEDYKRFLARADEKRRGDRDGRGNLSEERLADFAEFFLKMCIDQTEFMGGLMDARHLRDRVLSWTDREIAQGHLPKKANIVMRLVFATGEVERAEVDSVLGMTDRAARKITRALVDRGALISTSSRAPLRLNFSPALAQEWMPGLFPGQ
ncbi:MAG: Fic family protein [Alphaproteobacteria bacterium]|nr:Fic family protein [Alphaproteobacteria bacterium]